MFIDKELSIQNLDFNFRETKKNIADYFIRLQKIEWEWARLNAGKGLTANYEYIVECKKQPYIPTGKDEFSLLLKERKEEQLKKYLSSFYWAKNTLSNKEQVYIVESFINDKCQDEIVDLLGYYNRDSKEFRRLKRSAIYKFADVLNLVVKNQGGI